MSNLKEKASFLFKGLLLHHGFLSVKDIEAVWKKNEWRKENKQIWKRWKPDNMTEIEKDSLRLGN